MKLNFIRNWKWSLSWVCFLCDALCYLCSHWDLSVFKYWSCGEFVLQFNFYKLKCYNLYIPEQRFPINVLAASQMYSFHCCFDDLDTPLNTFWKYYRFELDNIFFSTWSKYALCISMSTNLSRVAKKWHDQRQNNGSKLKDSKCQSSGFALFFFLAKKGVCAYEECRRQQHLLCQVRSREIKVR